LSKGFCIFTAISPEFRTFEFFPCPSQSYAQAEAWGEVPIGLRRRCHGWPGIPGESRPQPRKTGLTPPSPIPPVRYLGADGPLSLWKLPQGMSAIKATVQPVGRLCGLPGPEPDKNSPTPQLGRGATNVLPQPLRVKKRSTGNWDFEVSHPRNSGSGWQEELKGTQLPFFIFSWP